MGLLDKAKAAAEQAATKAKEGVEDVQTKRDLSLTYDCMELPADPGLTIFTYTAEPGSRSEEALNLLASWAATHDQPETAPSPSAVTAASGKRNRAEQDRPRSGRPRGSA